VSAAEADTNRNVQMHGLEISADYHQFHVVDADMEKGCVPEWTQREVDDLLATGPGYVAIGTVSDGVLDVRVEVHAARPPIDPEPWDRIAESFVETSAGSVLVRGCMEYEPDSFRLQIPFASMSVRVMSSGLASEAEGSNGAGSDEERHVVQIWPKDIDVTTLTKRWSAS
jgi:hypothetical protein